ncbi:MAG: hypothetical protein AAF517_19220 [Planctomycetota bacterium]
MTYRKIQYGALSTAITLACVFQLYGDPPQDRGQAAAASDRVMLRVKGFRQAVYSKPRFGRRVAVLKQGQQVEVLSRGAKVPGSRKRWTEVSIAGTKPVKGWALLDVSGAKVTAQRTRTTTLGQDPAVSFVALAVKSLKELIKKAEQSRGDANKSFDKLADSVPTATSLDSFARSGGLRSGGAK